MREFLEIIKFLPEGHALCHEAIVGIRRQDGEVTEIVWQAMKAVRVENSWVIMDGTTPTQVLPARK